MQIPIVIALGTGLVALWSGRSFAGLATLHLRHTWIIFVALGTQLFFVVSPPSWFSASSASLVFVTTLAAVAVFLILNRDVTGMWLVAAGLALNCIVILTNGVMPVSPTAATFAGAELLTDSRHAQHGTHLRNEAMTDQTNLPWMGDVIPFPGMHIVASPGDLVIAAGLVRLIWSRTTRKTIRQKAPSLGPAPSL